MLRLKLRLKPDRRTGGQADETEMFFVGKKEKKLKGKGKRYPRMTRIYTNITNNK